MISERQTSAKAIVKDIFVDQERQFGERKRLVTFVVQTVNYIGPGCANVT